MRAYSSEQPMRLSTFKNRAAQEQLVMARTPADSRSGVLVIRSKLRALTASASFNVGGTIRASKGASDLLGLEIAGEVVAIGSDVSRWRW